MLTLVHSSSVTLAAETRAVTAQREVDEMLLEGDPRLGDTSWRRGHREHASYLGQIQTRAARKSLGWTGARYDFSLLDELERAALRLRGIRVPEDMTGVVSLTAARERKRFHIPTGPGCA